ncbi:peptidase C15 [Bosea sp. CS1GBMeth4]|uniref:pyroglutamyl-peptidase I family protein n=1 Tax=Bosea sp. CS1GBMeth4 TaxID=1892849 RepID=UPI001647644F|nr:peptidase C15 [Bosea sp. CS1GBMeth4]
MTRQRSPDLLVTGFGPFPHVRVNPTAGLARDVATSLRRAGMAAEALVLETSYAGGLPALRGHLAETKPRAVLMLGLAARARFVRVELFARGRSSRLHADARGGGPAAAAPGRSLPQRTSVSAGTALAALQRAGIRARTSPSAGRYLCDASYALALGACDRCVPVIFIHVPWLRPMPGLRPPGTVGAFRPGRERLIAALAAMGRRLAMAGRSPPGPAR